MFLVNGTDIGLISFSDLKQESKLVSESLRCVGSSVCVCMYIRGGPFTALAPRPTVFYCASPSIHPLSNPALRMNCRILYVGASR
jgi:hypothetical protein